MTISKVCPVCAATFYRNGRQARHWRNQIYCSSACFGRQNRTLDPAAHFWSKVAKSDDCWLWTASKDTGGYGLFDAVRLGLSRRMKAHRVAFFLQHGFLPSKGLVVMHKCDVRSCVNPDHLSVGTVAENNKDRAAKGRSVILRGSAHALARLTDDIVLAARAHKADGGNLKEFARQTGVSYQTVWRAALGQSWRHI